MISLYLHDSSCSFLYLVGFEENENGCAVQKIYQNGNTFNNSRGDKVEVGDHLASINGTSTFKMNVTDVCKILAACPSAEEIHLVLLRYVGPIRSSNAIEQQGYEVIDPDVARTQDLQLKKTNSFLNRTNSFGRKNSNVKEPIKLSKSLSRTGRQQLTEQKRQKAVSNDKENISNQMMSESNSKSKEKKKRNFFGLFKRRKGAQKKEKKPSK